MRATTLISSAAGAVPIPCPSTRASRRFWAPAFRRRRSRTLSIVTLTPPYPSGANSLSFSLGDETAADDDMGSESGYVVSNRRCLENGSWERLVTGRNVQRLVEHVEDKRLVDSSSGSDRVHHGAFRHQRRAS